MQGLLLEVIQKANPEAYAARVKRQGIVNAWNDPAFAEAVRKTGKKQLIVAGVTTDVCLVPPALSMQAEGFHIKVCLRLHRDMYFTEFNPASGAHSFLLRILLIHIDSASLMLAEVQLS